VSDDGLDDGAEPQLALDGTEHAALLARNEDATGILRVMAAISLVDIGPLDGQPASVSVQSMTSRGI